MKRYIVSMITIILILTFTNNSYSQGKNPRFSQVDINNFEEILNDSNYMWEKDSDKDGLCDGIEKILKTNPNKKDSDGDGLDDKLELELGLDPNKKDSDDDGINDIDRDSDNDGITNKEELRGKTNIKINDRFINKTFTRGESVSVTKEMLLDTCNLVYNLENDYLVGKQVREVINNKYTSLNDFTIIRHTKARNGLVAIALKKGDTTIISYQGSKDYKDWIGNFLTQFMPHPQRQSAIDFIKPIINKEEKTYITGHSLGGLLTQYVSNYLYENKYENIKAVTFNSANHLNPKHIKGEYGPPIIKRELRNSYIKTYIGIFLGIEEEKSYDSSIVNFFNESLYENGLIDLEDDKWKIKNNKEVNKDSITNYIVKSDPLYIIINGKYIGKDIIKDYKYSIEDVRKSKTELSNSHKLDNFRQDNDLEEIIPLPSKTQ